MFFFVVVEIRDKLLFVEEIYYDENIFTSAGGLPLSGAIFEIAIKGQGGGSLSAHT